MSETILLPYQRRWIADSSEVRVCEKGRRTGITWAQAADDVLTAATEGSAGMDVLYVGYNQEMTREYVDTAAQWAKQFQKAAEVSYEFLYRDEDRDILAYRITFASGHEIVALSSAPRNLRGRQGRVVIDEAAFHPDLPELLKAALALLVWGGQVVVISTHDGAENPFNELIQDIRAGKFPYGLHRITFDDALDEGLYRRICHVRGRQWAAESELAWRAKIVASYGDGADEELFCVPRSGGGQWLVRTVIEACMDADVPVLRWSPPAEDFVDWPLDVAALDVLDWCRRELDPLLDNLPLGSRTFFGEDFGRSGDLTVIWPLQELETLFLRTPFVLELSMAPFRTQEQILFHLVDGLPRFSGGALDARGNGQSLAEYARQRYGPDLIREVMLTEGWYRENMPRFKAHLEDRTMSLPRDAAILDDLRAFRMVRGVARVPDSRTRDDRGAQRHGDSGVAAALAVYATATIDVQEQTEVTTGSPWRAATILAGY